ncbi:YveK family protein [Clostridium sp. JS66]|uniref:YveK family protein n=1 Tax=Clostridium sp. JS66 TaxID=3064705 RepID=UPI00298E8CC5|nr:Wzz/FepE/Etk N-terminal domain-containing protein [Clostridium sp. JS66]WPC43279.1 Wzz/FepE/Etk N-terminal domain-containing protein [Clostridium sp. JS66]
MEYYLQNVLSVLSEMKGMDINMEEEISLDLHEFSHIIRKRIKLILLITTLSTVVAGILSYCVIKPMYESKATIVVGKTNASLGDKSKYEFNDIMMYQNLVKTYAEIGKSEIVAEKASSRLDNISSKNILGSITITPVANTQLIQFKAYNSNPQTAYLMLNAVCNSFMQEAERIYPGQNVQIMDGAEIPEKPIKPKKRLNVVIAFFIGLMASVGVSFLLEYMNNTLKTEQDINKYLGLPVIGIIPKDTVKY